jgi:hypothetical protein
MVVEQRRESGLQAAHLPETQKVPSAQAALPPHAPCPLQT